MPDSSPSCLPSVGLGSFQQRAFFKPPLLPLPSSPSFQAAPDVNQRQLGELRAVSHSQRLQVCTGFGGEVLIPTSLARHIEEGLKHTGHVWGCSRGFLAAPCNS